MCVNLVIVVLTVKEWELIECMEESQSCMEVTKVMVSRPSSCRGVFCEVLKKTVYVYKGLCVDISREYNHQKGSASKGQIRERE